MDRLRSALTELSEAQRRVFVCVDLEQLAPHEAAAALDMNPGTVRTTLHFARRRLARLLGKDEA
jgi:RNA polymerase sigma factor (sigma-70 family)